MTRTKKISKLNAQQGSNKKMSRQPPLPPGPPPSRNYNNSYDQPRGADTYRPAERYDYPPPQSMYQFRGNGGDSYHPQGGYSHSYDNRPRSPRSSYRPADNERSYRPTYNDPPPSGPTAVNATSYRQNESFDFRFDAPPGVDYRASERYRAPRSPSRGREFDRNGHQNNDNNQRRFTNGRGSYRGRGGPRLASDRAFLKTNREPTPELMPGMDEDSGNGVRYKAVEELSDSEEEDMDISESGEEGDASQPRKQVRTEAKAADGDSVPRWSNPDPYTALPPPDESQRKKKDVVKLIRKARVVAETDKNKPTEAAADDFISFDFGDEDDGAGEQPGLGVEGAPTGPRSSKSHAGSMREYFDKPNAELGSYERSSIATLPAASGLPPKPPANDIGNALRAIGSVPSGNFASGVGPSSGPGKPDSVSTTNNGKKPSIDVRSDPALGSRKRNIDDEIKAPPRLHGPDFGKKKPAASGSIVREWRPKGNENPTPWISMDHSDSAKMGIWLHKEIMDFYHYVKPRDVEQHIRVKVVENLREKIMRNYSQDADILAFGSFPAGLYLPTADMDLVCVSSKFMRGGTPIFHTKSNLYKFRQFLCNHGLPLDGRVEVIAKAKVPLCKYVDSLTGLKVDVSFENDTGLIANKTFQDWKTEFPAMPIIVSIIKHLLAMRGLNEPVNGGIGGFSVICLVVSLLQNMPQVQSGNMVPEHNLGEILMEFFDLYGNHFNIETTAISLKPPGYISKAHADVPYNQQNSNKFCIIDPNRGDNDISGGAKNSPAICSLFSECFYILQDRMAELQYSPAADRRCKSILGSIIAGNYSSFRLQREHLAHVYEKQARPIDLTTH